jgi:hypothetical protein
VLLPLKWHPTNTPTARLKTCLPSYKEPSSISGIISTISFSANLGFAVSIIAVTEMWFQGTLMQESLEGKRSSSALFLVVSVPFHFLPT